MQARDFFELVKAIGESKSKQEEDRIIAEEVRVWFGAWIVICTVLAHAYCYCEIIPGHLSLSVSCRVDTDFLSILLFCNRTLT